MTTGPGENRPSPRPMTVARRLNDTFGSGSPPFHFVQELAADAFNPLVHHPGKGLFPYIITRSLPQPHLFERPRFRQFSDDRLGHIRVLAAVDLLLQPPVEVTREPHTHLLA